MSDGHQQPRDERRGHAVDGPAQGGHHHGANGVQVDGQVQQRGHLPADEVYRNAQRQQKERHFAYVFGTFHL